MREVASAGWDGTDEALKAAITNAAEVVGLRCVSHTLLCLAAIDRNMEDFRNETQPPAFVSLCHTNSLPCCVSPEDVLNSYPHFVLVSNSTSWNTSVFCAICKAEIASNCPVFKPVEGGKYSLVKCQGNIKRHLEKLHSDFTLDLRESSSDCALDASDGAPLSSSMDL